MISDVRGDLDAAIHGTGMHHYSFRGERFEAPTIDPVPFDVLVQRGEHRPASAFELDAQQLDDVEFGEDVV